MNHFDKLVQYAEARGLPMKAFEYSRGFYICNKNGSSRGVLVYNANDNTFDTWLDKKKHTSYRKGRSLESVKRMVRKLTEQPKPQPQPTEQPKPQPQPTYQPHFGAGRMTEGEFTRKASELNNSYEKLVNEKLHHATSLLRLESEIARNISDWDKLIAYAGVGNQWAKEWRRG